ncbi:MAG: hypothetical protein ACO1OF_03710 [Adhaeribacter sp.]
MQKISENIFELFFSASSLGISPIQNFFPNKHNNFNLVVSSR